MINIKKFIDRVSMLEARQSKDLVMPMQEARGLRDELAKLLVDKLDNKSTDDEIINLEIKGKSFK